ncbi:cytoplasmic tRNA 2-thiolation protein 2 domain-containing protein [Hirsutella rhossiliensis]|uniref:Cytoplasmic tRNA 2-thiolation protein 2 n=1 Tax=Hirsutella rhossiliensis TaxID=111463 RepID=A0A9P8MSR8_9HYPO|nr:cytoplasmic tRNA 2-thiolation protein 2 domain-containing protein [Hirsutella rhossiliensis]KAH0960555.1 cytoplasmic tRNA 2-thiolation protein 2 domain-containing protein [Hirsutella rhossiliensis]
MASSPGNATSAPCNRCKDPAAPHTLRNYPTCRNCYVDYVEAKAGRRLGALARDTRTSARPAPRKYLAGLSFGPSSTAMTNVLDGSARFHSSRKSSPAFEPLVVHVDTNLSHAGPAQDTTAHKLLARYRERFPNVTFEYVHLSQALRIKSMDWSSLLRAGDRADHDTHRLRAFLDSLPSATSRADMLRLLVRNLLLDMALDRSSSALLLGHSTTALASLTLSEVANGRGFTIPWQINDGPYRMHVYYPLREILRNEIMLYLDLVPSLRDLVPADDASSTSVVSHKDLSIDEVIRRYFDGVEGPYSGIVTNVVRTTGKLDRATGSDGCPMCGMGVDEQGDSRWAGELGDDDAKPGSWTRLCYGCKRTMGG